MQYDFESIYREDDRRFGLTRSEPLPPVEDVGALGAIGDVLAAPFRGVEGAVRDVAGLLDVVTMDMIDVLPDEPWLGDSQTVAGEIVQGISNFAVGFIPALAAVKAVGITGKVASAAAAGAITDFTVFDGHEARLSDLLVQVPGLRNPVTEFLASDEDDHEVIGRLKAVVEGLGVGAMFDALVPGLRKLSKGRKAIAEGADEATALKAMDVDDPLDEAIKASTRKVPEKPDDFIDFGIEEGMDAIDAVMDPSRPLVLKGSRIQNLAQFQQLDDGAGRLIRSIEAIVRERRPDFMKGTTLEETTTRVRRTLTNLTDSGDPWKIISKGRTAPEEIIKATDTGLAIEMALMDQANQLAEVSSALAKNPDASNKDALDFLKAISFMAELQSSARNIGSATGLALNNRKIYKDLLRQLPELDSISNLASRSDIEESLSQLIKDSGGKEKLQAVARKLEMAFGSGDEEGIAQAMKLVNKPSRGIVDMGTEYFMNSILSGPKTHVVNLISGLMTSVYRPLELSVGSALRGNLGQAQTHLRELGSLMHSFSEGGRIARKVFQTGDGVLTASTGKMEVHSNAIEFDSDSLGARAGNVFGRFVRTPSRALQAMDEWVKQANYRAVAHSNFYDKAMAQGLDSLQTADFITKSMDKLIWKGQAYSSNSLFARGVEEATKSLPEGTSKADIYRSARNFLHENYDRNEFSGFSALSKEALERSEEVTFTKRLGQERLVERGGYHLQQAVNDLPVLRFFTPFVRTPANIIQWALDRTVNVPLGFGEVAFRRLTKSTDDAWSHFAKEMFSQDPKVKADVTGRISSAVAGSGIAFALAHGDTISGAGPNNPHERKLLEQEGWRPYSIKLGDGWASYRRFDPFASILGTVADIVDYTKFTETSEHENFVHQYAMGVIGALTKNFTEKSYMTGFENFLGIMSDPEQNLASWSEKMAGTMVPFSSGMSQLKFAVGNDDIIRDTNGLLDAMVNKVPGLSKTLPPMRNILGEPIQRTSAAGSDTIGRFMDAWLPIEYSKVSDSVVDIELAKARHGFTPPRKEWHGHDLLSFENSKGQNAYDRWTELHGEVEIGGKTMRQQLRKLFKTKGYQALPEDSFESIESPRVNHIRRIIGRYRRLSLRTTLKEYPELGQAESRQLTNKSRLSRGADPLQSLR